MGMGKDEGLIVIKRLVAMCFCLFVLLSYIICLINYVRGVVVTISSSSNISRFISISNIFHSFMYLSEFVDMMS